MKPLFLSFLLLLAGSQYSLAQQPPKPVSIIFDTDIGPDYDDVGAIALMHALADSGEARILATIASNKYAQVGAVLSVFNTWFGRPGLPIGVPKGKALDMPAWQKWDSVVTANYPHRISSNMELPDAVALYRKLLAAEPDTSVTIVTVGFFTNLANLLQTAPDKYSPLSGIDLVKQKVKRLVSMAGHFPAGKEFNVDRDIPASKAVVTQWPGTIIFSGFEIGVEVLTGLPLIGNEAIRNSPVKEVFAISIPLSKQDKNGRMSWDETAVLVAIRGWERYYTLRPGRFLINDDGSNGWDGQGSGHYYLVKKIPVAEVTALINQLIMHQPMHGKPAK